jgi:hypothetical protein
MTYATGTATSHTNLFALLRTFLGTTAGWTELVYEASPNPRMLFRAPGLSGTENIHIGFRLYADVPGDTFGIYGWMARSYDAGMDMESQPGMSGLRFMPLWDTSTPYWLHANGQRTIVVAKVSTTYQASYAGKFLQYGTAGEYGQPYYLGMPHSAAIRYSTISESVRNFWDPGPGLICNPNGSWYTVRNFYESSGVETADTATNWVHPYGGSSSDIRARWRELRDNLDGSYSMFPLIISGASPNADIYGELDGVMAVPGFSAASEDTLTVGGDTWRIFQNGFRTARYYFAAIKAA